MSKPTKNILVTVALVAALFIPTLIAIISFAVAQFAPVDVKSVTGLDIIDTKGNVYSLLKDNGDASDIAGFIKINDRAIEQPSLPDQFVGSDHFEFKYHSYDRTQVYKYYFSQNTDEAYYVDSHGRAYHINADDANAFLSTKYARCLYDTTSFPTMNISGVAIAPTQGEWVYKSYSGDYIALDDIVTAPATEDVYMMKGAFALNFDHEPDFCNVIISDGGTVVFSDSYSNIANASLEGKTIDVLVDAKWYETDTEACYGSSTYSFKAKILYPAVFYLGETAVEPGEFVVISAKNVDDPSAITFTSEPDIGFKPTFFADGNYARALVPVGMDFEGDSVKFTCSYGEVTQDMTLDIIDKTFGSSTLDISADIASQTRTETTLKLFNDTMAPIVAVTESTPLWDGLFLEGPESGLLRIGYGRYCTITGTGETYRHQGVDYLSSAGKSAYAVNNGKVAYAGFLDLTGYVVVIDHGLGLKSWYCHLGSPTVEAGDVVNKGDVVGYIGSTGFTATTTLHVGMSVYDVPVCPYDLWEEGILMTK